MSDNEGSGDQDAQAQQGHWLGAVRSWVGSVPAQEEEVPAANSSPALSADEIRRRRLERMEGTKTEVPIFVGSTFGDSVEDLGGICQCSAGNLAGGSTVLPLRVNCACRSMSAGATDVCLFNTAGT